MLSQEYKNKKNMKTVIEFLKERYKVLLVMIFLPPIVFIGIAMYWRVLNFLLSLFIPCSVYSSGYINCYLSNFLATISSIITFVLVGALIFWAIEHN